jgi:hypothetical protein
VSTASAAALRDGLEHSHWTVSELWRAALGVGGAFSPADVAGLTTGLLDATGIEHDILAAALNDHLNDQGDDHPVPYWRDLPGP